MGERVRWSDDADEVIRGDLTTAAAYLTPAGGTVATAVAPCGIGQQDTGMLGFTTSLGFGKKLERIVADPHVALAFHTREHGFSASPAFVLAQGIALVDLRPWRARLEALIPQVERYLGKVVRGPVWDRLLREYYAERVVVDTSFRRIAAWPDLSASGDMEVTGQAWPGFAARSRRRKTGPARVLTSRRRPGGSPRCRTGYWPTAALAVSPVIVPVQIAGHDRAGLRLVAATGCSRPVAAARACSPTPTGPSWSG
jgi:hypothetical protein